MTLRLLVFTFATVLLAGCGPAFGLPYVQNTPQFTGTPTLLPPYMATQQVAYVDSQSTKMAGEAQMQILSVQGTQVALDMTRAAATSAAIQKQYDAAQTATVGIQQTLVSGAQQTAVASTRAVETQQAQTEQAYIVGLTTMTPAAATAQAIFRQGESDQQAQWFSTWAYRVVLVIIFGLALAGMLFSGVALWDARWAILARLGLVTWGPDGKPYWVAPYKGGVALLDVSRSAEPALLLSMTGEVRSKGGLDDKVAQARLADHAQVIEHKLAEGTQAAQTKPAPLLDTTRAGRPALMQPPQNALPDETRRTPPVIMVLPPSDPRAKPWVEDAVKTVLDGGQVVDGEAWDASEEYE